jgi:DNA anti-recombination protein RmuC
MSRKLFAWGLLLAVGFGLWTAGLVSSQDQKEVYNKKDVYKDSKVGIVPGSPSLEQLVQQLKAVRAQKVELDRREQQLTAAIESRLTAERQQLQQDMEQRRRQLDEIERLIHRDAKQRGGKMAEWSDKGSSDKYPTKK